MRNTYHNIDFKHYTRWKIGGVIKELFVPDSKITLINKINELIDNNQNYTVVGQTSNLLIFDGYIDATIIKIGTNFSKHCFENEDVICDAGVDVPVLNWKLSQKGYSGIEHTCGIPGTIGGLVCMNGGSNRKSISENIKWVEVITKNGVIKKFNKLQCDFSYRNSIFQSGEYTILRVCLTNFTNCKKSDIRHKCLETYYQRKNKFPQKKPNCGSFFKRNLDVINTLGAPGRIIENLGFKGYKVGGAEVSTKHANFINNNQNASASDIINIGNEINNKVYDEYGFKFESEAKYLDEKGNIRVVING